MVWWGLWLLGRRNLAVTMTSTLCLTNVLHGPMTLAEAFVCETAVPEKFSHRLYLP